MSLLQKLIYLITYPFVALSLNGSTRTRVAVIHDGQVLFIRPRLGNGTWDLPGGGVHKGEKLTSSACREIKEELDIDIDPRDLKKIHFKTIHNFLFSFQAVYFAVVVDEKPPLKMQKLEIAGLKWMDAESRASHHLASGADEALSRCPS